MAKVGWDWGVEGRWEGRGGGLVGRTPYAGTLGRMGRGYRSMGVCASAKCDGTVRVVWKDVSMFV